MASTHTQQKAPHGGQAVSYHAALISARTLEASQVREFEAARSVVYEDYLLACAVYWQRWSEHATRTAGLLEKLRRLLVEVREAYVAHATHMEKLAKAYTVPPTSPGSPTGRCTPCIPCGAVISRFQVAD